MIVLTHWENICFVSLCKITCAYNTVWIWQFKIYVLEKLRVWVSEEKEIRGKISDTDFWQDVRPGIRETIYKISYWLLPRNKMETGWEPGQEAGHPLTGDKLISSCSSFLTKIKRSIKDKRARDGLAKAVGAALSTEQRMLCFSFKAISEGKKHCLTPQHLGQDGSCSSSSRLRHACEALLHSEQPHDSC